MRQGVVKDIRTCCDLGRQETIAKVIALGRSWRDGNPHAAGIQVIALRLIWIINPHRLHGVEWLDDSRNSCRFVNFLWDLVNFVLQVRDGSAVWTEELGVVLGNDGSNALVMPAMRTRCNKQALAGRYMQKADGTFQRLLALVEGHLPNVFVSNDTCN